MTTEPTKKNPTYIMFDIETMDLLPSAALTQVGVIAFQREGQSHKIISKLLLTVSPDHWGDNGRTFSGSTVAWWMGQSDKARESITNGLLTQRAVVETFHTFVLKYLDKKEGLVWSKGNLDILVMEDLFRVYNLQCPWLYSQVRDLRTLLWLSAPKLERTGVEHDAFEDARFQLEQLTASLNKLNHF